VGKEKRGRLNGGGKRGGLRGKGWERDFKRKEKGEWEDQGKGGEKGRVRVERGKVKGEKGRAQRWKKVEG